MSHDTEPATARTAATDRLVAALHDPGHLYTGEQLAYLLGADRRWRDDEARERGVRAGLEQARDEFTELMLDAIVRARHVRPFSESELRRHIQREHYRREHDTAARHPWRGDYTGGAVEVWEDPERGARADAYTAWLKQQPRVWP